MQFRGRFFPFREWPYLNSNPRRSVWDFAPVLREFFAAYDPNPDVRNHICGLLVVPSADAILAALETAHPAIREALVL